MNSAARNTSLAALRELDDAKLAQPVTVGAWRGRRASEWRLTFYRCDKTGELPTTQWEQGGPGLSAPVKALKCAPKAQREFRVHQ